MMSTLERIPEEEIFETEAMESVEEEMMEQPEVKAQEAEAPVAEEKMSYADKKRAEMAGVYRLRDETSLNVASDSKEMRGFLDLASRMGSYSVGNQLLIYAQCPQASQLKTMEDWNKDGASVKRGSKSLRIIAKIDYADKEGNPKSSWGCKRVFDASSVEGGKMRPAPTKSYDLKKFHTLMQKASFVKCEASDEIEKGAVAKYDNDKGVVYMEKGIEDPNVACAALAREIAHAGLSVAAGRKGQMYDRSENNFRATCVEYMVCKHYGIDTRGIRVSIPKELAQKNASEIQSELSEIRGTYNDISSRLDKVIVADREKKAKSKDDAR